MICDRCGDQISKGDEREHLGRVLCEDCYMDALSPARTCDPWAVHSAKSLSRESGGDLGVNETQAEILRILGEEGPTEPALLMDKLGIKPADLEREVAALRHMEKVRGELREGRRYLRLW